MGLLDLLGLRRAAAPAAGRPCRWLVLDVETSGLDAQRAHLLAIAAMAVNVPAAGKTGRPAIRLDDSFEIVVRHDAAEADHANILVHGIGVGAQRAGVPPQQALAAFRAWAAGAPMIAFHAAFDRTMIERACRLAGEPLPEGPWLDLEPLAAVLQPEVRARSLDEWMAALGIRCAVRHQAVADTLATAELLLKLWPALQRELRGSATDFRRVQALADTRRWLAR
jgi:DNA polymerase III subunit epsilon